MKIFTESFFRLTPADQSKVLDATLADIANQVYLSKQGEARARRTARQIEKKAVEYGVWSEATSS